jgi:transcriptional regulator with XRE-family HTH domain
MSKTEKQIMIQKVLLQKFEELKQRNKLFSLRAFAIRLNISSSALSEILNGKRRVSREKAENIAIALKLTPLETHEFLRDFSV